MNEITFYEAFDEEVSAIKKFLPKKIRAQFTWKTIQEQKDVVPPSNLVSIRTQSWVPRDWDKRVQGILTRSQGYDHLISFLRETSGDVCCGYLDNYCARAVAEQGVMIMMALLRKIKKQMVNFQTFARDGITGAECRGRKVFVAGVGHIGSEIVDIAKGLRMPVKGFDVDHKVNDLAYVPLDEGMAWANVVFCALPLTKKTEGLISYGNMKRGTPGKIFVNVGRGEISPVGDLKKLLDEGMLSGIGLDVFPEEPLLANILRAGKAGDNADTRIMLGLAERDDVIFTPHNGFNTHEALERKASLSADAVDHYFKHGAFPNPVPWP